MSVRHGRSQVVAVILILLASSLIPTLSSQSSSSPAPRFTAAQGGPGCGNGTDPCVVTFTESGLPSGANWNVTVSGAGKNASGGTTSVVFDLVNGTWNFQVGAYAGYSPAPGSSSLLVSGNDVGLPIVWTLPTYAVTFKESGLPSGTQWTVVLAGNGQASTSTTDVFPPLQNGTYPFTVTSSDSRYSPSPSSGNVVIKGPVASVPIVFSLQTYTVTFTESGFPLGGSASWKVTLGGTPESSSSSNTLTFLEPNGTFPFSVSSSTPQYQPQPASGSLTVNGAAYLEVISFIADEYPVYFNETGLPGGTSWSVALNGGPPSSSTGTSIVFLEFNGTYAFVVKSSNASFQPAPAKGSVTVAGHPLSTAVTFTLVTYSVAFEETGLPASQLPWTVTLGGAPQSSSSSTITFSQANGSYAWTVTAKPGWSAAPYFGSVTVTGTSVLVTLAWSQVLYFAWFNETGLPAGTNWTVTANSVFLKANTSSIVFDYPNGTYSFVIGKISGYRADSYSGKIQIAGAPTNQSVNWTRVTYTLSFLESGLPSGMRWNVTIVGQNTSSATVPIVSFYLPNGTYNYTVGQPLGFVAFPPGGAIAINGNPKSVTITYSAFSYSVAIVALGLASGTPWAVTVDGVRSTTNTSTISLSEANGSYTYQVGRLVGYIITPTGGTFHVAGAPTQVNITFAQVTYSVEFLLNTSLPASVNWSVTLGSTTEVAGGNQALVFDVPNGTFNFEIYRLLSYFPIAGTFKSCSHNGTLPIGNVTVCGKGVLLSVGFTHIPGWAVTFVEDGLVSGIAWSISIAGVVAFNTTATIVLPSVSNGTYSYYVGYVPGYTVSVSSGILRVNGQPIQVNVSFVKVDGAYVGPPRGFSLFEEALVGAGALAAVLVGAVLWRRQRHSDGTA